MLCSILTHIVDMDNIRVIQTRRGTRFLNKPLAERRRIGIRFAQNLNRDRPIQ